MTRAPRLLLSQSYYHIIARGNNRMTIFKSGDDFQYYLKLLDRFKKELPFDLYHYCIMPNHVHMLVRTQKGDNFSLFMKKINLAYFSHFKKTYGWMGHLWQDRFRSQPVGKDNYFIQCGKYIERNPMRAGLVDRPEQYIYSSYHFYTSGRKDNLITRDLFYNDLAKTEFERRERYQNLLIDEKIIESYKGEVWGSNSQRYNETRKIHYHLNDNLN